MKNVSNILGAWLGLAASLYWLCGVIYLPTLLANYNAISQTISELSAISTPLANRINFGWSLPLGMLQCGAVLTEYRQQHITAEVRNGLAAFGCVGIAYVACSFFPCDPGAPLWGSWRQLVHNAFGGLEYAGGGLGLLLLGKARSENDRLAMAHQLSGLLVWMGLLLMTIPGLFGVRGAVQRVILTHTLEVSVFALKVRQSYLLSETGGAEEISAKQDLWTYAVYFRWAFLKHGFDGIK